MVDGTLAPIRSGLRPRVAIKRAYDPARPADGKRILVDRLWPRGLTKKAASIDEWLRELAPSDELRRWYHQHPRRFADFRARYRDELLQQLPRVAALAIEVERHRITLVFAAREPDRSNAAVLQELLLEGVR
ncbi:MAG: DUF488 domain-containing protein [Thermoplasmata archaeon]